MTNATKRRAILFLILTALITVLLAVTLPQLELQRGVPLPAAKSQTQAAPQEVGGPPVSISRNTFLEAILALFVLMMFIYLMTKWRQRLNLKDILRAALAFAVLSVSLTFLLFAFSNVKVNMTPSAVEILPPEVADVPIGPPLAPVPTALLWLVWIGLAGLLLLMVIMMMRTRARMQRKAERDPLALEAEQAAEAIKAGQDLSNVIIRCYRQMSLVLKKEQGLTLEETMTAREFEALLEKRGIPNHPVRQLTRLFEIARYGAQATGAAEERQAIDCLNAIAQYSLKKEPGQPK